MYFSNADAILANGAWARFDISQGRLLFLVALTLGRALLPKRKFSRLSVAG